MKNSQAGELCKTQKISEIDSAVLVSDMNLSSMRLSDVIRGVCGGVVRIRNAFARRISSWLIRFSKFANLIDEFGFICKARKVRKIADFSGIEGFLGLKNFQFAKVLEGRL